jgi:exosome complex RNA-binding protein Rrp42 (RNase PH superfamily)
VAPVPAFHVNVTVLPLRVDGEVGDVITAAADAALNAVYVYSLYTFVPPPIV